MLRNSQHFLFYRQTDLSVPNPNNSGSPFPRLSGSVQTAADILLLRKREINVNYTCIIVKYTLHLCRDYFFYRLLKIIVIMEKIFLLPNGFKKVGWIILIPQELYLIT